MRSRRSATEAREQRIEEYVKEIVAEAPPLTEDQRQLLANLLGSGAAT
jgi:hypothetical protein